MQELGIIFWMQALGIVTIPIIKLSRIMLGISVNVGLYCCCDWPNFTLFIVHLLCLRWSVVLALFSRHSHLHHSAWTLPWWLFMLMTTSSLLSKPYINPTFRQMRLIAYCFHLNIYFLWILLHSRSWFRVQMPSQSVPLRRHEVVSGAWSSLWWSSQLSWWIRWGPSLPYVDPSVTL